MSEKLTFVKVKSVTRPLLRSDAKPIIFQSQGPIFQAPATEEGRAKKDGNGNILPPPELMHVINMETGEEAQIVVFKVLGNNLRETYPNDSYVGKYFEVTKFAKGDKRYATFSISELAIKTPETEAVKKK